MHRNPRADDRMGPPCGDNASMASPSRHARHATSTLTAPPYRVDRRTFFHDQGAHHLHRQREPRARRRDLPVRRDAPRRVPRSPRSPTARSSSRSARTSAASTASSSSRPARRSNHNLMELLIMIDALKRASAGSHHRGHPVLRLRAAGPQGHAAHAHHRQARRRPRSPPRAPTACSPIDLHAGQIQGFFNIPFDHLFAMPVLLDDLRGTLHGKDAVVVSPDAGGVERARAYSKRLGATLAIIDKRRAAPNVSEVMNIIGDVRGKDAVIVDDMIDTAGTLTHAATRGHGGRRAHRSRPAPPTRVLSGPAVQRIEESPLARGRRHRHDPAAPRRQGRARRSSSCQRRAPARRGDQAHPPRRLDQRSVHLEESKERSWKSESSPSRIATSTGKNAKRAALRAPGKIPAICYGGGAEPDAASAVDPTRADEGARPGQEDRTPSSS